MNKFFLESYLHILMLFFILFYLFINIFNGFSNVLGGGDLFVLIYISLGGMFFFFERIYVNTIRINKIEFIVGLFFCYYIFKAIWDFNFDGQKVFSYTFGTTGGMILFFIMGYVFSFIKIGRFSKILIYVILFILLFSLFYLYSLNLSNKRLDVFLLSDLDVSYQRIGDFLSIVNIIIFSVIFSYYNKYKKINNLILLLFFVSTTVIIFLLSQLVGSNKAAVLSVILFLLYFVVNFERKDIFKYFLFSLLLSSIGYYYFSSLDLSGYRLFGFGGDVSSVSSRIELFYNNFLLHFFYNPIFGNLEVDKILTGEGTYIHSAFFYSLTHLGLIGFLIFSFLTYVVFKRTILYKEKYYLYLYLSVLFLAAIGTVVTWAVLWFVIGMISSLKLDGK